MRKLLLTSVLALLASTAQAGEVLRSDVQRYLEALSQKNHSVFDMPAHQKRLVELGKGQIYNGATEEALRAALPDVRGHFAKIEEACPSSPVVRGSYLTGYSFDADTGHVTLWFNCGPYSQKYNVDTEKIQ